MLAFKGPRPNGKEVCHGDGVASNDRLDNLRYDTHLANMADMKDHGTLPDRRGELNIQAKLTPAEVRKIRKLLASVSQTRIAEAFGITQAAVSAIKTRKTWSHL